MQRSAKKGKRMRLRVIGGSLKSRIVLLPSGFAGRPTKDIVREALFDILFDVVVGSSFLDLYCGSGITGIEAISRGAQKAWLVDNNFVAHKTAKDIATQLGVLDKVQVVKSDALKFLQEAAQKNIQFDIIFCDPPYAVGPGEIESRLMPLIATLAQDGTLVMEHDEDVEYPAKLLAFEKTKEKRYGGTKLSFYSRALPGNI